VIKQKSSLLAENVGTLILFGALVGSLGLNLNLGLTIRAMKTPPSAGGVKVGSVLSVIPLADLPGKPRQIELEKGRRNVLYVMSPDCVWCARNLDNIRALAGGVGERYAFVGLSNTANKLDVYVASTPLPFPVVVPDKSKLPKGLDLNATPQTVVVSENGTVEKVWVGAFGGDNLADAEKYFGVQLPGLPKATPAPASNH